MPRFHDLAVTAIDRTTRDAVVVTLEPETDADFSFTQGQYLTFRKDFDGEELRRSYSICTGRDDGVLQVGIKRVDGGAFSTWANTHLKVGDRLQAMAPTGTFFTERNDVGAPHYLAIAGGSGITPILSILRTELASNPQTKITLIYANRNINTIMFREEIADLKDAFMGRLSVIHMLSDDAQEIELFQGFLDAEKCAALFRQWIDISSVTTAYICGPEPMIKTVAEALKTHGLAHDQIRFELFASGQKGRAKVRPPSDADKTEGIPVRVTLDGETRSFTMDRAVSLLDGALVNDIEAPFACRGGVCSTCKAKLLEGEVDMTANHALEDYEVEQGYVLTCQSFAKSDKVVFDYDQASH